MDLNKIMNNLEKKHPGEVEYLQAVREVLESIENVVNEKNFKTLGTPRRYSMPEEMMFNTHYHLNKRGVDYRTQLLIEDIKIQEGK